MTRLPSPYRKQLLVGTLASTVLNIIAAPARAQTVAIVQNIQPAPLTIAMPYTTFTSQQSAIVTLQINEPATLTVSPPVLAELEDPPGTQQTSSLSYNNSTVANNTPLNISTPGTIDVAIDMEVVRTQPYPVNDYTYSILLTITPQ